MTRHQIEKHFSLSQIIGFNIVDINTVKWTDQTPEGLAKFIQTNAPDWKELIVTKNIIVIDPQKKNGNMVVSKKQSQLKIGRTGYGSLCIMVDPDLTLNGKIPQHIRNFFGEKQK